MRLRYLSYKVKYNNAKIDHLIFTMISKLTSLYFNIFWPPLGKAMYVVVLS